LEGRRLGRVRLYYSRHGSDAQAHLVGNLFDGQTAVPQPDYLGAVEYAFRPTNRISSLRPVVASVFHSRHNSLTDAGAGCLPAELILSGQVQGLAGS
jgi:hypothetical protein